VVLHPKDIPWFVSDVLVQDFGALLSALKEPVKFFTSTDSTQSENNAPQLTEEQIRQLNFLFENWAGHHSEGRIILRPNVFWTKADNYWRLPFTAKELYEDLKASEVVIFKGDLNYRKLTGDAAWDPTTPFSEAI